MKQLTTAVEIEAAQARPSAVLLLYADWCPFSVLMHDALEQVEPRHRDLEFFKVPTDIAPWLVPSIPTTFFNMPTGSQRIAGYRPVAAIEKLLAAASAPVAEAQPPLPLGLPAARYRLQVQAPTDLSAYRTRSRIAVLDPAGATVGEVRLDRYSTQALLFLQHVRDQQEEAAIVMPRGLTPRGRSMHDLWKKRNRIQETAFEHAKNSGDLQHFSKFFSRINDKFRKLAGGPVVEKSEQTGYRISDRIELDVHQDGG